jgi:nitrilase
VAGKEHLVVADVDPASAQGSRQLVDPSGLYARPDVFALEVDRRRPETASFTD